jgi:hypothetical protein
VKELPHRDLPVCPSNFLASVIGHGIEPAGAVKWARICAGGKTASQIPILEKKPDRPALAYQRTPAGPPFAASARQGTTTMTRKTRPAAIAQPLAADILLPAQFFPAVAALGDPERRLRLAIVADAFRYFQQHCGGSGGSQRRAA